MLLLPVVMKLRTGLIIFGIVATLFDCSLILVVVSCSAQEDSLIVAFKITILCNSLDVFLKGKQGNLHCYETKWPPQEFAMLKRCTGL